MISNTILIGITVGVFFAGIGVSYAIFTSTYDPNTMKFHNQELFDQMMSQNPKMMRNWMETMMQDAQFHDQAMDYMAKNPEQMNQWMIHDPKHVEEMSTAMKENHDFMMEMMSVMMNDPALRLQMLGHMTENPESMEQMKKMMGQSMMSSEMMSGSSMMGDSSMMSSMPFNPEMPITIPMIDGYYDDEKVFFIHTEISDQKMANMMSMMVNFPTIYVSDLENIPDEDLGKFYVFTNGITGTGPYGGGPFMFQIDIFDSVPGQDEYSEFRVPQLVTWKDDSSPRLLTSVDELLQAETNGELSIKSADFVVHLPMISWDSGTKKQIEHIEKPFNTMPKFDAQVINFDEDNYTVTLQFHQIGSMNIME